MRRDTLSIGLVGPLPPPSGGMANQTRQLARLLEADGVKVELVQVNRPYVPSWIASLRGVRSLPRLAAFLVTLWRVCGQVRVLHVMANSGWAWHLFAAPAIWTGWLRGIPVVVNYRGGGAEAFMRRAAPLVKASLRRATTVVVPSGFLRDVFAKWDVTTTTIPNIVDVARFRPSGEASGIKEASLWNIVVARNLEPIYDIGTAIRAVDRLRQRIPNVRLIIAGAGPQRDSLVDLVKALHMETTVEFVGRVDNDRMHDLYARAHAVLNPSLVDNMPISVLEALASGVPVVSTNVGGVPYLVKDRSTALLVPPGDSDAMSEALATCLHDGPLRNALIEQGLSLARQHAWTSVGPMWMETYSRAVESGAGRSQPEVGSS